MNRLRKQGVKVEQQHPLTVYDEDGTILGEYFADLFVEDCLIVELKAVKATIDEHGVQLLGYAPFHWPSIVRRAMRSENRTSQCES